MKELHVTGRKLAGRVLRFLVARLDGTPKTRVD